MHGVTCLLMLAAALAAQTPAGDPAGAAAVRKLNSTILTMKDGASRFSVGQQLAADIASLADRDHRPSQKIVRQLADKLVASLSAADLRPDLLSQLTASIVAVLESAGTSTIGFLETVERAGKSLRAMGVAAPDARALSDTLKEMGMQVRGPEDSPVGSPFVPRQRK